MKKILLLSVVVLLAACNGDAPSTATTPTKAATTATNTSTTKVTVPANNTKPAPAAASNALKPATLADLGDYKPKNEGWHVLLDEAYKESEKTGKPIMANFTGSDWCGWCKRLDKSVFHTPGFDKWADDNVVLLELDFPRRFKLPNAVAQQNRGLQQTFGVRGYPTVWLFDLAKDDTGKFNISALGKTGYTKTFDEFKNVMTGYMSARG